MGTDSQMENRMTASGWEGRAREWRDLAKRKKDSWTWIIVW